MNETITVSCKIIEDAIGYMWRWERVTPSYIELPMWQLLAISRGTMRKRAFRRWRGKLRAEMREARR